METLNQTAPPLVQAEDHWDEETRTLSYTYGDRPLISINIPGSAEPSYRRDSDGTLNSIPLIQQIYVMVPENVCCDVTLHLGPDAVNMRPKRAASEQAILGQVGRPLVPGVNGVYDIGRDFLLNWYGRPWSWKAPRLERDPSRPGRDESGGLVARLEVELGPSAWFLNFLPHFYRTHLGYKYHAPWEKRPELKPISGWCSWEAFRRNVSQEAIEQVADFCARHFKPYGLEFVQLDDGFESLPMPVDPTAPIPKAWLEIDPEKFPEGHPGIVKAIADTGLSPGIWTSVSIYNDEFAKHQPECLVKDRDGNPILGDWIKYLIDCKPETLAKHVAPTYAGLAKFGYKYFKTDVTRHLLFDGFHKAVADGSMTNEESEAKHRAYLVAAREAIGDEAFWLLSWGVMTEGAGAVDACRISMDALPTWSGLRMQIIESARWWHTQRILWQNDPDHVCMRAKTEWARAVLSMASLTGGLLMLSDSTDKYDEERVHMIQRCLPPLPTVAGETGPLDTEYTAFTWTKFHGFGVLNDPPYAAEDTDEEEARNMAGWSPTMDDDHPIGSLWAFHIDNEVGRWCVVYRAAVAPLRSSEVALDALGLEEAEYLAFDFWKQKFLGRVKGSLPLGSLPLGHCQVIALRRARNHPQFLSSSRHVSQDAVSVLGQEWTSSRLTLKLRGVRDAKETYWIHLPAGFSAVSATGTGLSAVLGKSRAEAAAVKVTFQQENAELTVETLA